MSTNESQAVMAIQVQQEENGDLIITWDHDHPVAIANGMNEWDEETWLSKLVEYASASQDASDSNGDQQN